MDGETKAAGANNKEQAAEPREWLTLRQAAAELQLSQASLRRAYHRQELVAFMIGTRLRIRRADLQAWLESQRWSPALCQERTARPRAGRRKGRVGGLVAEPSPANNNTRTR
jgi:excisionase family DNA binding protein